MIQTSLIDNLKNAIGRTPRAIANNAFKYNELCERDAEAALLKGSKIVELLIYNLFAINQITTETEEKHNLIKTLIDKGTIPSKLKIHFLYFGELYVRLLNSTLDEDLSDDIEQCSLSINQILKWYIQDVLPNNTSDYQIKFVNGSAITQEMVRQAVLIDETVYYSQDAWVKADICWDWFQKNPDIYIMGINTETNRVVSYLNAMPISDSYFNTIASGNFLDSQIPQNEIKSYNLPGFYKLYICSIAIDPAFQNCDICNKMLDAFMSKLLQLASKGIYITDVIADGFTENGKRLCELYGMKKIISSSHDSEVYKITLIPPTFITYRKDSQKLYELYKEKFSEFEKINSENKVQQTTSLIEKHDVNQTSDYEKDLQRLIITIDNSINNSIVAKSDSSINKAKVESK